MGQSRGRPSLRPALRLRSSVPPGSGATSEMLAPLAPPAPRTQRPQPARRRRLSPLLRPSPREQESSAAGFVVPQVYVRPCLCTAASLPIE